MSRILVITSCTSRKVAVLPGGRVPAARLYAGEQHTRLMAGVDNFRSSPSVRSQGHLLDVWIVSAGHGLVNEDDEVGTYDATFAGMRRTNLSERTEELGIPQTLRTVLSQSFDLGLLLLGGDYVRAGNLDHRVELGGPMVAFASAETNRLLADVPSLRTVRVGIEDTRRFGSGLVGLKGELARRLLTRLGREPSAIKRVGKQDFKLLDWLATPEPRSQLEFAA